MDKDQIIAKLSAMGAEIATATDQVLDGMAQGERALRTLNEVQNRLHSIIAVLSEAQPNSSPDSISADIRISDIAKSAETVEIASAPKGPPEAQDSRKTVTSAVGAVGGAGDGADAVGGGLAADMTAQSAQAVAETASGKPEAALDAGLIDKVLDLHATGVLTHSEIGEQVGGADAKAIIQSGRIKGDPRAARGDLRRVEALTSGPKEMPLPTPAAPAVGIFLPSKQNTIQPEQSDVGNPLALVNVKEEVVAGPKGEVRMTGAALRVVARLNDQHLYALDTLVQLGRYASGAIFRSRLIDMQRSLRNVGLHIVEIPQVGFQLRLISDEDA